MAKKLKLFSVLLDWAAPGSDEGDYSTWVWAENDDEAVRLVANEMADSDEKEFDTDDERDEYADSVICNAGPYAASEVTATIGPELEMLLKGPEGEWTPETQCDFDSIKSVLAKYIPAAEPARKPSGMSGGLG